MRKLLWIGDAVVASGFAKVTHKILDVLKETWDVHVLALNYVGDPHKLPYPCYPCWPGGDGFGVKRTSTLISGIRPDIVVIQNDPWNIGNYLKETGMTPVVATMPVDGKNCRAEALNGLRHAIWWTEFGKNEAIRGGYRGPSSVIPLGVDLNTFRPSPFSVESTRREAGLPEEVADVFIVGNVNRNQPRKRLDLTIQYFAEWVKSFNVQDAYLFLHVAPTGDKGYDVRQLFGYYGLAKRLILSEPSIGFGVPEPILVKTYQSFDVQVNTGQGEGWGLTSLEGMACGIPQLLPDWSALGEWAKDHALMVPCSTQSVTPNNINVIGGLPDKDLFIKGLQKMYCPKCREGFAAKALACASLPQYRWEAIGAQYNEVLEGVLRS